MSLDKLLAKKYKKPIIYVALDNAEKIACYDNGYNNAIEDSAVTLEKGLREVIDIDDIESMLSQMSLLVGHDNRAKATAIVTYLLTELGVEPRGKEA